MLCKLLNEERIIVGSDAADAAAAIGEAGALLEKDGCITADYTRACIAALKEMGPYMVLAGGLALPHSRPENGALQTAVSLVIPRKPVCFGHKTNDPVQLVFFLAAADSQAHLQALRDISLFAIHPEYLNALAGARTPAEAYAYIRGITEGRENG